MGMVDVHGNADRKSLGKVLRGQAQDFSGFINNLEDADRIWALHNNSNVFVQLVSGQEGIFGSDSREEVQTPEGRRS